MRWSILHRFWNRKIRQFRHTPVNWKNGLTAISVYLWIVSEALRFRKKLLMPKDFLWLTRILSEKEDFFRFFFNISQISRRIQVMRYYLVRWILWTIRSNPRWSVWLFRPVIGKTCWKKRWKACFHRLIRILKSLWSMTAERILRM